MCSQVQHCTITQEAILACMNTYNYISSRSLTPANTARCSLPIEILNTVLNMGTGKLLEMQHLLVNPKYKALWGRSYTTELGCLAQGIPGVSKDTNTIVFITRNVIPFAWLKDDRILSPLQSPRTPTRVQPNLAPDLTTKLFGRETSIRCASTTAKSPSSHRTSALNFRKY
jgi:hypothetical protein